ncbi:MAG TPA: class A beta-lactamase [Rhodanobacteraceae bacterium]
MQRRQFLQGVAAASAALLLRPAFAVGRDTAVQLAALERSRGGRLGVAILDTASGQRAALHGNQRFLMCSTYKLPLVASVLNRVDAGKEHLDRRIVFGRDVLLDWAPVTERHVGPPGMSVAALCEAAITVSDNTAANLLLASVGGPAAVTAYIRTLGDPVTRVDRNEPSVNRPDGDKDTTTPWAMLADLHKLLLRDALLPASRTRLTDWLLACRTGTDSLRAGLPRTWREGDKTGSNDAANNDVAIAWPPRRKPLLVTAFYDNAALHVDARKQVLAHVGRIVAAL